MLFAECVISQRKYGKLRFIKLTGKYLYQHIFLVPFIPSERLLLSFLSHDIVQSLDQPRHDTGKPILLKALKTTK